MADQIKTVRFSDSHSQLSAFLNWAPYAIRLDDSTWPTVDHYLTAERYPALNCNLVRGCPTTLELATLVLERSPVPRSRWDVWRDEFLLKALCAKFAQHIDLEEMLMDTGDARLVYISETDHDLGQSADGVGHNMLGRLLMRVRDRREQHSREEAYQELLQVENRASSQTMDDWQHAELAECYLLAGMVDRAVSCARVATNQWPECEYAWRVLAAALMARSDYDEAYQVLRVLVRMDPEYVSYHADLARVCDLTGRKVAAKIWARRARLLGDDVE